MRPKTPLLASILLVSLLSAPASTDAQDAATERTAIATWQVFFIDFGDFVDCWTFFDNGDFLSDHFTLNLGFSTGGWFQHRKNFTAGQGFFRGRLRERGAASFGGIQKGNRLKNVVYALTDELGLLETSRISGFLNNACVPGSASLKAGEERRIPGRILFEER